MQFKTTTSARTVVKTEAGNKTGREIGKREEPSAQAWGEQKLVQLLGETGGPQSRKNGTTV